MVNLIENNMGTISGNIGRCFRIWKHRVLLNRNLRFSKVIGMVYLFIAYSVIALDYSYSMVVMRGEKGGIGYVVSVILFIIVYILFIFINQILFIAKLISKRSLLIFDILTLVILISLTISGLFYGSS